MSDALEAKLADVEKERDAAQYMLAFVLLAIGEPVVLKNELFVEGLPKGVGIAVDEDHRSDCVIISLVKDSE